MDGWANLGAAFGGDSEKSYQEGLALGAQTENALAQARQRVEQNAARARMEQDLIATGLGRNEARAASTALSAGAGLTDPISLLLKNQEFGFRAKAGDPNVPLDEGQRALLGVAPGPVEPIYKVGNRAFNKFETPANIDDLGAVFGGDSGGSSAFIQSARAFGLLEPDGSIRPENRALAYEILRNTDKAFDVGGVPNIYSGNPYGAPGPRGVTPVGAPPQGPQAAGPSPATSAPGPTARPLASVADVAANKGTIAAATEQGQAQGRNAAGLESYFSTVDKFGSEIDKFLEMPGFDSAYGNWQGTDLGAAVTGLGSQDAANAQAQLGVLKGQAFLANIQKMRGFGQLSNMEGGKVEGAYTRAINARIGSEEARQAWAEVKTHLAELKRVAAIEAGQAPSGAAPAAPADAGGWQTINGVRIRVKPQ